jgi:hypothetical protein
MSFVTFAIGTVINAYGSSIVFTSGCTHYVSLGLKEKSPNAYDKQNGGGDTIGPYPSLLRPIKFTFSK